MQKQKSETAALTGELWHQIVNIPKDDFISKWEKIPTCGLLYYNININQEGCNLTPKTDTEEQNPMYYEYVEFRSSDRFIPTLTRETENNESDLFKIYFGKYGNKFFPICNLYSYFITPIYNCFFYLLIIFCK